MLGLETVAALIAKHGLVLIAPVAVLEGPIVTVIAAWLASQGLFPLWAVVAVVILADLVGDLGFYALGRRGLARLPRGWRDRLGLGEARLAALTGHFEARGGRTLFLGKLTHSVGFAILVAAGAARMRLVPFLVFNLVATVPKSLVFVGLGWGFGAAYARIDGWIARASLVVLALAMVFAVSWWLMRRVRT